MVNITIMRILAIETSCDETAIAIVDFNRKTRHVKILANLVSSQIEIHKPFGGVVPNLARREHEKNLVQILMEALKKAGLLNVVKSDINKRKRQTWRDPTSGTHHLRVSEVGSRGYRTSEAVDKILAREPELLEHFKKEVLPLKVPKIDAIAVTYGPGLAPALWVGVNFAKALSYIWKKPLIPVNHMEGHIFSALVEQKPYGNSKLKTLNPKQIQNLKSKTTNYKLQTTNFPALALLVSGGHTELVLIKKPWEYKIVGETIDDASGEAFDKVARILDLPYPGGPHISALAEISRTNADTKIADKRGSASKEVGLPKIELPRPMLHSKDFNFSFSGLKTAVLYLVRDLKQAQCDEIGCPRTKSHQYLGHPISVEVKAAIAREFQDAVVEVLVTKTVRAAEKYKAKTIILGGGVAANSLLRKELGVRCQVSGVRCLLPMPSATGDNALMIALAAAVTGKIKAPNKVGARSNLRLSG